ncbi:MAG: MlaD family protein [Gemmatimonadota bacterium]
MIEGQSRRVLAGFALLLGLVSLLVAVFLADRIRDAFEKRYALYAVFPTAPRLRVGSAVWIGGHPVGEVVSIGFQPVLADSSLSIAVRVEIPTKHRSLIRRNSTVRLATARLIGEPVVDIIPGDRGLPPLDDGDTLFALPPVSSGQAMRSLARFNQSLDSLLATTRGLTPAATRSRLQFARLTTRLDRLQLEFADIKNNMSGGSGGLLMNDSALQNAFAQTGRTAQQLGTAFQSVASKFTDPQLRQAFAGLQQRASGISAQLEQLRTQFANGSLPRFAQDTAIMKALHAAQLELDSLVAITRRDPLRFWLGGK